jgi:hypothetical protein
MHVLPQRYRKEEEPVVLMTTGFHRATFFYCLYTPKDCTRCAVVLSVDNLSLDGKRIRQQEK